MQSQSDSDRAIDLVISNILRGGVLLSSILVCVGMIGFMSRNWSDPFTEAEFAKGLNSIAGVMSQVSDGEPAAIVQLGILVLLSTPFLRVAFAAVAFLKQRDWVYVAIALLVLSGLGYSLLFSSEW